MVQTMSKLEVLIAAMKEGYVSFTYRKVDGTIRHAIGTRNLDKIINITGCALSGKKEHSNTTPYFDLAKMDWRCFKNENLISIEYSDVTEKQALEIACSLQIEIKSSDSFIKLKEYIENKGYKIILSHNIVRIVEVETYSTYPDIDFEDIITVKATYSSLNESEKIAYNVDSVKGNQGSDYDVDRLFTRKSKKELFNQLAELKLKEAEIYKELAKWEEM